MKLGPKKQNKKHLKTYIKEMRNLNQSKKSKICFIAVLWWFHRVGKYIISRAMLKFREGMLRDLVILKLQI